LPKRAKLVKKIKFCQRAKFALKIPLKFDPKSP
jgi:hypothetical protein